MNQNQKDLHAEDEVSKKTKTPFGMQVFLGFISYVSLYGIALLPYDLFKPFPVTSVVVVACILIIGSIFLYLGCGWKGFFLGVLVGLGLTVLAIGLLVGLCFAAISRK